MTTMPNFSYKARGSAGNLVKGVMVAEDEDRLAVALKGRELYLIEAKEKKEKKEKREREALFVWGSVRHRDVIDFTSHLAAVLSAGIPILQGLQDLENHTKNRKLRQIIKKLREDIYGGSSLSAALSRFPKVFSSGYVNMVKVGEASGNVDMILKELTKFLEWQQELVGDVKKASAYPLMIFVAIAILMTVLFAFSFPRITKILLQMKVPLPLITRVVIGVSGFFQHNWWLMFSGLALIIVGLKVAGRSPKGRFWIDKVKLRLPVVGDLACKIALSRFAHHLAVMWRAGIDVLQALTLVEGVVGNAVIARAIARAREEVSAGGRLSESLQKSKEFSPLVIRMISIAEMTGNMEEGLARVSQYYDREVPTTIKKIFSIIEPLTIVFLAFMILAVALSLYLPLYTALGRLGK